MDDPKCMLLIDQLGMEGYGIYWALLEKLRTQPGLRLPLKVVPVLAKRLGTSEAKLRSVISGYGLFLTDDEGCFYAPALLDHLDANTRRREAARRAVRQRWDDRQKELFASSAEAEEVAADEPANEQTDTESASRTYESIGRDTECNSYDDLSIRICNSVFKPHNQVFANSEAAAPENKSTSLNNNNNIYNNNIPGESREIEGAGGKRRRRQPPDVFLPPTAEEVADYVKSKGYAVNAHAFCSFYASKGWMVGKNKMKNWKQAVTTWAFRDKQQTHDGTDKQETTARAAYDGCLV